MAKKVKEVNVITDNGNAPTEVEKIVAEKKSVKEIIDLEAAVIVEDVAKIQAKLKELAVFANTNRRPHKHFTIFSNDMELFVRRFKRMLR